MDETTLDVSRGHFARVSVEIDLAKPLVAKFMFKRKVRCLEYEGLHLVCFHCGHYGHRIETCPTLAIASTSAETQQGDPPTDVEMAPLLRKNDLNCSMPLAFRCSPPGIVDSESQKIPLAIILQSIQAVKVRRVTTLQPQPK